MKYGDIVVFVQKQVDESVRRTNAIVLASRMLAPVGADRKRIEDAEPEEHLDLAFPVLTLVPDGQALKTRNMEEIFRPSYDVRPMADGAWTGWEPMVADRIHGSPREVVEQAFGDASETIARLRKDLANAADLLGQSENNVQHKDGVIQLLNEEIGRLKSPALARGFLQKSADAPVQATDDTAVLSLQQHAARIPFTELTAEQKAATIYPTWDGIVTESGKTEADLEAEHATQKAEAQS